MKNKLKFLISSSLKKKTKTKWFMVANLILALIVIGIINIDSIITFFGGDFNEKSKIYLVDETASIYDTFNESVKIIEKNIYDEGSNHFEIIKSDKSVDELKKIIKDDEKSAIIINIYNKNESDEIGSKLISLSTMDTVDYQILSSALTQSTSIYTMGSLGLTEEQFNKLMTPIEMEREIMDENITSEDENTTMIMTTVFPVVILPFFMLTIFLVQFIGSEINDEKSTRSMEIIISNVSPRVHFAAKVIANNLFVLLQGFLLIFYAIIGFVVRKALGGDSILNGVGSEVGKTLKVLTTGSMGDKLVPIIILTLILMILTFIAYSLIAGILASMTTNPEDYQHLQTPIVIILLLGYYLAIMAGMFKGALFIKILSFIPLISAVLSPSLFVLGQIGIMEIIISILIMIGTLYLLFKYGIRIYKVGILNYSSTGMWKKMFKSVKNKD